MDELPATPATEEAAAKRGPLTEALSSALTGPSDHPRQIVERTALALLTYIEENAEGFQVLVRDSPSTDPAGSFSSLLGEVSMKVEELLAVSFKQRKLPTKGVPYYAQMLVGMTVFTGQYWADQRKVGKEQLAAHIVNLAWHGLSRLEAKPTLLFEGAKAKRAHSSAAALPAAHTVITVTAADDIPSEAGATADDTEPDIAAGPDGATAAATR